MPLEEERRGDDYQGFFFYFKCFLKKKTNLSLYITFNKNQLLGAGEMAQQWRALAALLEDLEPVASSLMAAHSHV